MEVGVGGRPLPPPSSSFPPVSGQTRKIYFLESERREPEANRGIILLHTSIKKDWLTIALNIAICLWGRCEIAERKPAPTGPSFHHVLRLPSNLRFFPSRRLPTRSLSLSIALSPGPCPPPDCPLFINAIKETECRASTVGFLPCRCREPAVRSGRIYAGKRIHHSRRQLARRGLSIPNSHRENRTFRPFSTVFNPPTIPMNNLYPSMLFHITSIHDFYAKIFTCIYFCISSRYKNLYLAYFISRRNDTNAKIASW